MRLLLAVVVTLLVAGCATNPVPTAQTALVPPQRVYNESYAQPSRGTTKVIVKRDAPRIGVDCENLLSVDGVKVAEIEPSERLVLYLSPKQHIISISKPTCGHAQRVLVIHPAIGHTETIRIWSDKFGHLAVQSVGS